MTTLRFWSSQLNGNPRLVNSTSQDLSFISFCSFCHCLIGVPAEAPRCQSTQLLKIRFDYFTFMLENSEGHLY